MWKFTQRAFTGGRLDAELMGRQDLQKYFQGASELKNFHVRRQGYLSKRRGTDFVCDFENLLGCVSEDKVGTYNSINKIKAIPLVHDRDKGYYILATANRAYLASKDGIRLMNGAYTKRIEDSFTYTDSEGNEKTKTYTLEDYEVKDEASKGNKDPYKGDKPYSIGEIGYDTLQSAINHASSGERIMVRAEAVETSAVTVTTPTKVTLDLNGHNITFNLTTAFLTLNHKDAELKIVNSVNTTASLSHAATPNINCVTVTLGHLILGNGGFIYGKGVSSSSNGINIGASGRLTVDGGKIDVNYTAINCTAGCVVTINRGEAVSRTYAIFSGASTKVEINGGKFNCVYGLATGITVVINGGYWECSNRPFHSTTTVNGGRFKLTVADYYYAATVVTNRGEFYCAVDNTELTTSLNNGKAFANVNPTREVDGVVYSGYKQHLEPDYHYDLPLDNYVSDKPPYDSEETEEILPEREIPIEQDKRPYYISFPVADSELDALNSTQSGDTIFFAHRSYAPFTVVFDGTEITATRIQFSSSKWYRPRIVSVTMKDGSNFGDGAAKTVYYACTYVKDGIESELSAPYGFSYTLPWGDKAALHITCDKGNNAEEPDYFNIYKKSDVSFGLIATLGSDEVIEATTEVSGEQKATVIAQRSYYSDPNNSSPYLQEEKQNENYYLNKRFLSTVLKEGKTIYNQLVIYSLPIFVGGISYGKSAQFDFGEKSGVVIDKFIIGLDALCYRDEYIYKKGSFYGSWYYFSGEYFRLTLVTVDEKGNEHRIIKAVHSSKPTSDTMIVCGLNKISHAENNYALPRSLKREIEVSFKEELDEIYPTKISSSTKPKDNYQVKSLKIEAYDNEQDFNPVDFYYHGIQFVTSESSNREFDDDYITPDISVTPPVMENIFTDTASFPSCVGIYQQRLCYASSTEEPFTYWMSCVGDLYNFNTHDSIREDDAITATLAATEFPEINHIVVNRDLMLLAESGEWQISPVSGNTLSYKTIQSKMQSAIGCAKNLKPINVGDEIIFVKQSGETLLATRYNFASDGYESMDLSVISQWIFKNNPIQEMAYRQHPDSTIECVLTDGTIATLVYMKEHNICAWSRHEFGGGWKARGVVTNKSISNGSSEIMFLVERDGKFQMWKVRDDIPIRAENKAIDHICLDSLRELTEDETLIDGMTEVVIGNRRYAGYAFEAELKTVRPELQGAETIQFEIKNANDIEVRVLDSGSFTVRSADVTKDLATVVHAGEGISDNGSIILSSKDYKSILSGCNSGDGRICIESKTAFPLNILTLSVNYEIQPLYNSEG